MAIKVELKITHGSEPKLLKELKYEFESWNDNPFLYEQNLIEILTKIVENYGKTLEVNGYPQK